MAVDFTNEKVSLAPIDYSKTVLTVVKNISANLNLVSDKHNGLIEEVQKELNNLQEQINELSGTDIEELKEKVKILRELLGEGDLENKFIDVIDEINKLIDFVNSSTKTETFEYIFNSQTGEVEVDLSKFNFDKKEDYELLVSLNDFKPVLLNVEKIDGKTAKILARDLRHFAELDIKYKVEKDADGSFVNAFPITILVSYKKPVINEKLDREPTLR